MVSLLERNIAEIERRLVLLSPSASCIPAFFRNGSTDQHRHRRLVHEVQRLRGSIYLQDGAVARQQLSPDGLHEIAEDKKSWHLLMLSASGSINACVWYLEHQDAKSLHQLRAGSCALARDARWRDTLRQAVEGEIARARRDRLRYAEVGGWAVAKHSRCTAEGLLLALAAYSLGRLFGGALGLTTATVRHQSSTILRRLGGAYLEADGTVVPAYYDPHYRCDMELLRFDSRTPNPKYSRLIDSLKDRLANVTVIAGQPAVYPCATVPLEPSFAA